MHPSTFQYPIWTTSAEKSHSRLGGPQFRETHDLEHSQPPFSEEEILAAVREIAADKALMATLGQFLKASWSVIKDDVMAAASSELLP